MAVQDQSTGGLGWLAFSVAVLRLFIRRTRVATQIAVEIQHKAQGCPKRAFSSAWHDLASKGYSLQVSRRPRTKNPMTVYVPLLGFTQF